MNIDQFNTVLEQLPRQQQRVLNKFLAGESDSQLAASLNITQGTVRKHIESICKAFGLKNLPGERLSKRSELRSLFYRYKPEWVSSGALKKQTATQDLSPYIHQFSVYDSVWTGRSDLLTELSDRLQGNCRLLLLVGITGIGKTALAERLSIELHNQDCFDLQKLRRKNFDHKLTLSDFPSIAIKWLEESGENVSLEERNEKVGRDSYWSDNHDGSGQNRLGYLLMEMRLALGGQGIPPHPYNRQDFAASMNRLSAP
jgi:hypothetical protein